jgi:lipopolysaccharide export system protein LptA
MNPNAARLLAMLLAMAPIAIAAAKTTDRDQSMRVTSSSSDCSAGDGPCILTGNVHIVQGTLDIQSTRAEVNRSKDGDVDTVKLTGGPVKLKQQNDDGGWMTATADRVDYAMTDETVTLIGNANVQQPEKGSIVGGRIVYNTRSGQVQSGAAAGDKGPVVMTFPPKKKGPAKADAAPADKPQDKK